MITPELIERVAIAMRDRPPGTYPHGDTMGYHRLNARAALESILPQLIEALKKNGDLDASDN